MEMIPEETAVAPAMEGLVEPAPAQGDLRPPGQPDPAGSAGVPQERTLPGAAGQPQPQPASEPPGDAEQPGPGAAGQPSSTEGEPPPSPYLTPDFGKEDPFEILGKAAPPPSPVLCALSPARWRWHPGTLHGAAAQGSAMSPPLPSRDAGSCSWLVAHRQPSSSGFTVNRAKCGVSPPQASPSRAWHAWRCPGLPGGTRSLSCRGSDSRRLAAGEGQRVPCPAPPSLGARRGGCAKPSSGGCWGVGGSPRGPAPAELGSAGAWGAPEWACPGWASRTWWHGGGGTEGASKTCSGVARRGECARQDGGHGGRHAAAWPGKGERDTRVGGPRVASRHAAG